MKFVHLFYRIALERTLCKLIKLSHQSTPSAHFTIHISNCAPKNCDNAHKIVYVTDIEILHISCMPRNGAKNIKKNNTQNVHVWKFSMTTVSNTVLFSTSYYPQSIVLSRDGIFVRMDSCIFESSFSFEYFQFSIIGFHCRHHVQKSDFCFKKI